MAFTNGKRQRTELPSIVDDIILSHYFFEVNIVQKQEKIDID